jgi:hypothetical protein
MSQHDMALHEAVGEARACTPAQIRAVVRTLALSGVLGPEVEAREKSNSQAEQAQTADIEVILILHLLDACGVKLATLLVESARWRDSKPAVATAVASLGMTRQDMHRRIAEFASLLTPVGLPAAEGESPAGWLRVLHDEIQEFAGAMAKASTSALPEAGAELAIISRAARRTAQLADTILGMLDYAVLDIAGTVKRWQGERPVIRQTIDRLSLMLDEWPSLMKSTRDVLRGPLSDMAEQLHVLRSMLPSRREGNRLGEGATDDAARVAVVLGKRVAAIRATLHAPCVIPTLS